MANQDSTQSTNARSMDSLIAMIDCYSKEINQQINQVAAVANGGEAWAGKTSTDGDEFDPTSKGMFSTIANIAERAGTYYAMRDAIAELQSLVSKKSFQTQ